MTPQEQEAFAKGRLQGLNEMDEAHQRCADFQERVRLMGENDQRNVTSLELEMYVQKLRQEYSGK